MIFSGNAPIGERIRVLQERVRAKALESGREPEEIGLVLVTKTVEPARILEAFQAGVLDFAENRVQELLAKKKEFAPAVRWHMIGHLQTNKVRQVIAHAVLIHSLDRPELALEIEKQAKAQDISMVNCLLQVNTTGETSKSGFDPGAVESFMGSLDPSSRVRVQGLMTIGPLEGGPAGARDAFRRLRDLRERLRKRFPERDWGTLSMGMSGDFEIAIEEGATLLRIGSLIFGKRG